MNAIPIKAVKILTEINFLLHDALNNNLQAFEYIDEKKRREYTQEEKESLKKYDISKIISEFQKNTKKRDMIKYINSNINKEDKSIILTELILKGIYGEPSLGNIRPKELFLFTPKCKCCGATLESEYHFESPLKKYPYNNKRCLNCSHNEAVLICDCQCCSKKWNELERKFVEFEPYFDMGYSITNQVTQLEYELFNTEDTKTFVELIKNESVYPGRVFTIKNREGDTIAMIDEIKVV